MVLYRVLISLFAVWVVLREGRARLAVADPAPGRHVWVHGASNGELASLRALMEGLVEARPDLHWLVTANTRSGRDLVQGWGLQRVSARLAPVDLAWVVRKVMRRWDVQAHVSLEAEVWPNRIVLCPGPVLLLGARMSAGTARGWARLPGLAARVFGRVALASAQDTGSETRLAALGLPASARAPVVDLKAYYAAPRLAPDATLQAAFPKAQTWLAASTHEGDEEGVLDAHRRASKSEPGLRLILAPRHPRRAKELRRMIENTGLAVAQRSLGEAPEGCAVYLADSFGEMPMWYALAGRVFIGGTWSDRGGHTPYEPASFGAALIHGPDMRNFRAAAQRLAEARAATLVHDAKALAEALNALADPEAQRAAGQAARRALAPTVGLGVLQSSVLSVLDGP